VEKGAATLEFFAGLAIELTGRTIPATADHLHFTTRVPYGVAGVITAFNHPAMFALARSAAALVAGNAVILKPSSATPLSAIKLSQIADACLPPGIFNVVVGDSDSGRAVVEHPDVPRIAFTGSLETGLRVQQLAAGSGHVKHVSLQLGGKNPLVVFPDADLDRAVEAAIEGMNFTRVNGQSCGSTSRVLVHASVHDEFVRRLVERVEALTFGDPIDDATELGPLVSAAQRDRVAEFVRVALDEGARLACGGRQPEPPFSDGFYYPPTIFTEVRPQMRIAREEVFGPVLAVLSWSSEADVVATVNSVRYGLTASVYTKDLDTALRMTRAIRAGYVWINDVERRWVGVPFGGVKDSGTATEYSVDELYSFSQNKTVNIALS
jgi:2-formylbenzoate dehydrogenase